MFVQLALFFVVPATAIILTIVYVAYRETTHSDDDSGNASSFISEMIHNFGNYVTILSSQSLIHATLGAVAEGAIGVAVAELYLNRNPSWYICLQRSGPKLIPLIVCGFLAGSAILIGYFFFYIPGLILKLNFMVVTPVLLFDTQANPSEEGSHHPYTILSALSRSWSLMNGHLWYAFGCLMGLDAVHLIITGLLRLLFIELDPNSMYYSLAFQAAKAIPSSVLVPAYGILKTVVYLNLLVQKESLTKEGFAHQMDSSWMDASTVPLLMASSSLDPPFPSTDDELPQVNERSITADDPELLPVEASQKSESPADGSTLSSKNSLQR